MQEQTAKAIILKKNKYSESDLIVQFITQSGEKFSAIARGALRSKKRFAGGILEPTHYIEVHFKKSQDHKLSVLLEAQMIDDFHKIRQSYDHIQLALHFVECVQKVSQEGDSGSANLYNLLGHSLKTLQEIKNLRRFRLHFHVKFLHQQGILETEPWMFDFIKTSIMQSDEIKITESDLAKYGKFSEEHVRNYLSRAERGY